MVGAAKEGKREAGEIGRFPCRRGVKAEAGALNRPRWWAGARGREKGRRGAGWCAGGKRKGRNGATAGRGNELGRAWEGERRRSEVRSTGPPAGRPGREERRGPGQFLELGWKGRKWDFSKTNPFLFLIFKSKPNSNQIQVWFQIYLPIQIKIDNFVRLPNINFTTLKILLFFSNLLFFLFFYFKAIFKPFSKTFQITLEFWINTTHHDKLYAPTCINNQC